VRRAPQREGGGEAGQQRAGLLIGRPSRQNERAEPVRRPDAATRSPATTPAPQAPPAPSPPRRQPTGPTDNPPARPPPQPQRLPAADHRARNSPEPSASSTAAPSRPTVITDALLCTRPTRPPEPPVRQPTMARSSSATGGVNKGHAARPRWLAAGVMLSEINRDRESADGEVCEARGPVRRPAFRSRPRDGVRKMTAKALGASAPGSNTWWLGSGACHFPCVEHLSAVISAGNPGSYRSAVRVR
jgi:hypothetical protein